MGKASCKKDRKDEHVWFLNYINDNPDESITTSKLFSICKKGFFGLKVWCCRNKISCSW